MTAITSLRKETVELADTIVPANRQLARVEVNAVKTPELAKVLRLRPIASYFGTTPIAKTIRLARTPCYSGVPNAPRSPDVECPTLFLRRGRAFDDRAAIASALLLG